MPSGRKNIHEDSKPFKEGEDERRNTTGANKGSKWKSTLLKDLMTMDLTESEMDSFKEFTDKFPSFFDNEDKDKNFHLFMELKQMSLVFNKNPQISQNAINSIKDRIQGKPTQSVDLKVDKKPVFAVYDGRDKPKK